MKVIRLFLKYNYCTDFNICIIPDILSDESSDIDSTLIIESEIDLTFKSSDKDNINNKV